MQEFEHSPVPDHKHYIRTLKLPSGKSIEVIAFDDAVPAQRELHRCPECAGRLVYPVGWEQAGDSHWEISLRCPDCEWAVTEIFDNAAVEGFDETLDLGTEALVDELRAFARTNMEEDIDRFVAAIAAGHVLPEDF